MIFDFCREICFPSPKGRKFHIAFIFTQIFLSQIICIISTFNERLYFLKSKITPLRVGENDFDFCREICCHDPKGSKFHITFIFTQIFLSQIICIISPLNERLYLKNLKSLPLGLGKMIFDFCREICCHDPKGSRL